MIPVVAGGKSTGNQTGFQRIYLQLNIPDNILSFLGRMIYQVCLAKED